MLSGAVRRHEAGIFRPEANVDMLLHQVFDTMLSFAARVIGGEMPDNDETTRWAFEQIYSFVAPNVREELLRTDTAAEK